ncbi:MAG: DUF2585 family protein [Acidobacteria bacterium]|nr:DUF2585 family protein [Acidobacteriota bacterium]
MSKQKNSHRLVPMNYLETDNQNRLFAFNSWRDYLPYLLILAVIAAAIFELHWQGRIWWCKWDALYYLWSNDAWGKHNSQHLFDPYSFTHILHGFFFYWVLTLIFRRRLPLKWLLFCAIFVESAWEMLENTDSIIQQYRTATLALNYFGDSVVNSFGDILSCAVGFIIARKLGFWRSFAVFIFIEIVLIFWIHDSLLINIIMLIHPVEAIKTWQSGN